MKYFRAYLLFLGLFYLNSCDNKSGVTPNNQPLEFEIKIQNHKFYPSAIEVPANKRVKLIIENCDDEAEEFESFSLHREKIIPGKSKVKVNIGPLEPGEYLFFGEFHIKTAKGSVIAK